MNHGYGYVLRIFRNEFCFVGKVFRLDLTLSLHVNIYHSTSPLDVIKEIYFRFHCFALHSFWLLINCIQHRTYYICISLYISPNVFQRLSPLCFWKYIRFDYLTTDSSTVSTCSKRQKKRCFAFILKSWNSSYVLLIKHSIFISET